MIGQTLGHYRIVEQIGAGGMGVVYRAKDERLDRDVAVKVLPAGTLTDEAVRKRFRQEALALSKLNHPNIATVYDFDTQAGVDFLAMEYVAGTTLAEKLAGGPLSSKELTVIGVQVAAALEEAHERGVVHRDLKPGNIMLTPKGRVKVLDFGLAKLLHPVREAPAESLTQAHAAVGTLPYMAPEQLRGEAAEARTDIYATGAVLYEMATGQRPFPETQAPPLIDAILHQVPQPPSAVNRRVSLALESIILKCLDKEPERRYQSAKELRVDLERLSAQSTLANDLLQSVLPPRPTPLLGRVRELAAIQALLTSDVRLVTLTGPPGIGKSRLALELAALIASEARHGVAMVDLVPVGDPVRVGAAIAQTLGIREAPERPALARVADALRERAFLLVLDNFEHVLDAASQVGQLLGTCPGLRVLVTSRVPLHLAWEHEFPVPPLALPEPEALGALDALAECPSVALLLARARAAAPDFKLTASNARTLTEICCRLDGLPLAIELAAPWVKLLPLPTVLERLQHRLDFLHRVGRDLPARHQTLRAAIGGSYTLLQPHEQALLRRLSVFVGGFTLEAAETVCWSADQPGEAIDALNTLVDASLIGRDVAIEEPRFRTLETIREFAAEQLAATGELARTRRHHTAYTLALAEHAETRLHGPEAARWLQRLNREHDNFRAALTWALQEGEGQAALRLAVALWWSWYVSGQLREGRAWLKTALAASDPPLALRAKALYAAGVLAWRQGEFQTAAELGEESLRISRDISDRWGTANALFLLEMVARTRGDYVKAAALMEESLSLFRAVNDTWGVATALLGLGGIMRLRGEHRGAVVNYEESLRLFRNLQDLSGVAASLYSLGLVVHEQGDVGRASDLAMEALAVARTQEDRSREAFAWHLKGLVARTRGDYAQAAAGFEASRALFDHIGDTWGVAYSLGSLGAVARLQGDHARATALFRQSLSLRNQHGDRWGIADCLEGLGVTAAAQGSVDRGARLLGAAEALRDELGTPLGPVDRPDHDRVVAATRATLGKRRFESAWSGGRAVPLELLLQEILSGTEEPTVATQTRGSRGAGPLSAREMEVARLIARGMTNQEVASALYVTPGTVATHVQHIFAKLGYNSRAQIAAWASTRATEASPKEQAPR